MNAPRRLTLTVTPDQAGRKVDDLLRGTLGLSGTAVKRAKRLEDGLLLDGVRVTVGDRVEAGQVLSVAVGDTVSSGDILGSVGNTAIAESALPDHLHFSMDKDGAPVDPLSYLTK